MNKLFLILSTLGISLNFAFSAKPLNILFIFTDDHAYQAISAYGSNRNKTPNIDRLAKEGMLFDRAFVTNSICAPSRAVILTGKHSHLNGQLTNGQRFDGEQQTFPKLLQKKGYQTAMVGKWHLEVDQNSKPWFKENFGSVETWCNSLGRNYLQMIKRKSYHFYLF